jgi:hypothetical protein
MKRVVQLGLWFCIPASASFAFCRFMILFAQVWGQQARRKVGFGTQGIFRILLTCGLGVILVGLIFDHRWAAWLTAFAYFPFAVLSFYSALSPDADDRRTIPLGAGWPFASTAGWALGTSSWGEFPEVARS